MFHNDTIISSKHSCRNKGYVLESFLGVYMSYTIPICKLDLKCIALYQQTHYYSEIDAFVELIVAKSQNITIEECMELLEKHGNVKGILAVRAKARI